MTNRTEPHITTPEQLRSIVKLTREYLDLLEHAANCGQQWEGTPDQQEINDMACELCELLINKAHLETIRDRIDERVAEEKRINDAHAMSIKMGGISTMGR